MIISYIFSSLFGMQTAKTQNKSSGVMSRGELHSMLRVNHAGEYGATQIYKGQLFILGKDSTIQHMAIQEKEHLRAFTHLIIAQEVRPSVLQPLWHIGGFAMGALTAIMGRNVAHACTHAVETVIEKHYTQQLHALEEASLLSLSGQGIVCPESDFSNAKKNLKELIQKCKDEEVEHKSIAAEESGMDLEKNFPVTTASIKKITQIAIEIAKRI